MSHTTNTSAEQNLHRRARTGKVSPREAAQKLYGKPIEDWDDMELAHGRPRNRSGTFNGPKPEWLTPLVVEEAQRRFREVVKAKVNVIGLGSIAVLEKLLQDDGVTTDERSGREYWRVAPGVRAEIARYLLDQMIGRATQPVDVNANVKLVGLLAQVVTQGADGDPAVGFAERVDFQGDAEEPEEEEDTG